MSRYRKIEVRTWADEKFRRLSPIPPCGQGLWFYLLTGPHTSPIPGLFRAGRAAMAEDLDWPVEAFDEAFGEAFREGMVKADFKAKLVWLPRAVRYNKPESPNVVRSWKAEMDALPECPLKWEAIEGLRAEIGTLGKGYADAFNSLFPKEETAAEKPFDKPSEAPSNKPGGKPSGKASGNPSPKTMPNQEQEQEQYSEDKSSGADAPPVDLKKQVFDLGVGYLAQAARKPLGSARTLVGKWVSAHGEAATLDVLMAAQRHGPVDPVPWIEAAFKARANRTPAGTPKLKLVPRERWEKSGDWEAWEDRVIGWTKQPVTWRSNLYGPPPDDPGYWGPPDLARPKSKGDAA